MKRIVFLIVLGLFCCGGVSAAETAKAPNRMRKVKSLSLNNVQMKEAARLISIATGTPIVVSHAAAKVKVDVHLENVSAETALKSLCQASGLWYQLDRKENVLHVMTAEEFKSSLQFDRSERVEVVQILYPAAKDVGDAVAKLYVDRVIWLDPRKSSGDRYNDISKALKRMDLLGKRGTFDIVDDESSDSDDEDDDDDDDDNNKKTEAEKAAKIDLSKVNAGKLRNLLQMGSRESGKEVKANQLMNVPGVVFISVLPENNSLMLRSSDSAAIEEILKVVEKLDKPTPQVLLEVKVLSILLDDSRERGVDFLFSSNDGKISGGFVNGSLVAGGGQDILKPTEYTPSTGSGLVPQGSGLNPKAASITGLNKNFKVRVQLLETDERVTQLASPNLLVGNNESTALFIGTETTVMEKAQSTTTYTEVSSGVFQPNVSWKIDAPRRKIGTSLLLTPKIHADRTVTLRLLQEKSSLGQQTKNTYSGGTVNTGTEEQYFISQDIDLQRIVTTVIGKDTEFMVIGGLIYEEVGKSAEKVPGLGDIPYIGDLLFTRMQANRQRKEILIIVRPFVMLAPGEAQVVTKSYLERMSQHPAAREDMPSLGVNTPDELAKPKIVNPNDPWFVRLFDQIRGWQVDDTSAFDLQEQFNRNDRRKNHQEALKEIERIQKNEK